MSEIPVNVGLQLVNKTVLLVMSLDSAATVIAAIEVKLVSREEDLRAWLLPVLKLAEADLFRVIDRSKVKVAFQDHQMNELIREFIANLKEGK